METMRQITEQTERGTTWLINLDEFETPEALAEWLVAGAQPSEYRVDGNTIFATDQAVDDAIVALEAGIDEQQS